MTATPHFQAEVEEHWWSRIEDVTRFAALRVAFGAVLLADVSHLFAHLSVFPNVHGWPLRPALLLWLLALVFLILGYRTRLAAVVNYLCCAVILGLLAPNGDFQQAAGDAVTIGLALLTVVLPCGAAFSIDRLRKAGAPLRIGSAGRWALAAYITFIYADSGVHKLLSPMWSSGFGLATPMQLPSLVWIDTGWLTLFPPPLLRVAGWAVVAFELTFPALYAFRITRVPALLLGMGLHLGIGIVYPIPVFGGLMLAIYIGLLPERWYEPLRNLEMYLMGVVARRSRPVQPARSAPRRLTGRMMVSALTLWAAAVALVYAPQFVTNRPLWLALKGLRRMSFVTTGTSNREVFADVLFIHYRYQLRLVGPDGTLLPYSRGNLLNWQIRDRAWDQWWKRTQGPWVPMTEADANLAAWAECCAVPTEVRYPATIRIEGRPQAVEMHAIDAALFLRNNAVAWQPLGVVVLSQDRNKKTIWNDPPTVGEKKLGEYLSRVLR